MSIIKPDEGHGSRYATGLIAIVAALFFIPFLGGVHLFDWDEINFAEISREMLLTGEYTRVYVDFEPFWEKPPFFFWLQAGAMSLFGVGEFAARLPNALCGILTLILLFHMGKQLYDSHFAWIWSLVYFGSVLPHLYFRSGIIDPWFNLFIFCGLYFFILFHWEKNGHVEGEAPKAGLSLSKSKWVYLFWGGMILGMGVLTKGPVAYLIVALTMFVYWVYQRFRFYVNPLEFLLFTLAVMLISLVWYGLETWKNGPWFVRTFHIYQYRLFSTPDAGHKGFPGYHFVALLLGCFPASVFAIRSFFKLPVADSRYQADFMLWMKMLFWVVLILFTIVKSKIVHYSSMCYFPLTFLASWVIYYILKKDLPIARWMYAGLVLIGSLFAVAVMALPYVGRHVEVIRPLFKDPFAQANLDANVHWSGWEALPGLWLLLVLGCSLWCLYRQKRRRAVIALFLGTALFVTAGLFLIIGKIEHYSQRAAIEFFESKVGEDCYIRPVGYKTYAHLFYARKQPVTKPDSYDWNWLMSEKRDKPLYLITPIHKARKLQKQYPNFHKIGSKNGFVFFQLE